MQSLRDVGVRGAGGAEVRPTRVHEIGADPRRVGLGGGVPVRQQAARYQPAIGRLGRMDDAERSSQYGCCDDCAEHDTYSGRLACEGARPARGMASEHGEGFFL